MMRQYLMKMKKRVNKISIYWEELIEANNKNEAIYKSMVLRPKSKYIYISLLFFLIDLQCKKLEVFLFYTK